MQKHQKHQKYIKFDVILDGFYEIDKINTDTSFKHYRESTESSRIRDKETEQIHGETEKKIKAFDNARHENYIQTHSQPGSRKNSISKFKPQDSNTTRKKSFQNITQSRRPSLSKIPIAASTATTAVSTPRNNLSLHRSASTATTAASTEVNTAANTPRENSMLDDYYLYNEFDDDHISEDTKSVKLKRIQ